METEVEAREPIATPSAAVSAAPDLDEDVEIGPSASAEHVGGNDEATNAAVNGHSGNSDEPEDALRIESRQEDEAAELVVQEDGKRVKVYELRDQSWHDRGTGQCKGIYDDSQDLALLVVEAEEIGGDKEQGGFLKEELLLSAKVEREDIYARQQDTLIVWTEPSGLDIALSFQDAEGCEDIWQFILEVQRHLNNLPSDSDNAPPPTSSPLSASPIPLLTAPLAAERLRWQPPTLSNIREHAHLLLMQTRSALARERVVEHILTEDYIKNLINVFEQAEDLESLEDLHTLHDVMQGIILLNDNGVLEYVLQDEIFEGVIGMLEYDRDFPSIKTSFRQLFREISKFRQVVEIKDGGICNKIHQTYRLQYLKEVVLSRVLDDSIFNILNGFIFFNQVDIIGHMLQNEEILTELFACFKDESDEARQRDAVLFLHQLMLMGKAIQLQNRVALYRALSEKGLMGVIEWAFQRTEASIVHAAAEMLTVKAEHDALGLRRQIVQDADAKRPKTLLTEIISLHGRTSNTGLSSQLTDVMRVLLEPPADNEAFPRKDMIAPEAFLNYFYDSCCSDLFRPLVELPDIEPNSNLKLDRRTATQVQHLIELLYYCITNHTARASYYVQTTVVNKKIMNLLYLRDKPLRLVVTRYLKSCLKTGNIFLIKRFIKNDLLAPLIAMLEAESRRDNMLTSACMTIFDEIRKDNLKGVINYLFEKYPARLDALSKRPFFKSSIQALHDRYEQINEKEEAVKLDEEDFAPDAEARQAQWFAESDEEESKPVPPKRKRPIGPTQPHKRRSPKAGPSTRASGSGLGQSALGLDYDDSSDNDSADGSPSRSKADADDTSGSIDVDMDATASEAATGTEVKSEPELAAELNDVAEQMRKKREREDDEEEFGLVAKKQDDKKKAGSPGAGKKQKGMMGGDKEKSKDAEQGNEKKDKDEKGGSKVKLNWNLNALRRFGSGKKAFGQSATTTTTTTTEADSAPVAETDAAQQSDTNSKLDSGAQGQV